MGSFHFQNKSQSGNAKLQSRFTKLGFAEADRENSVQFWVWIFDFY